MSRTDTASRTVPHPPERVYRALVDPEALVTWLPPEGMRGEFTHYDLRPGGTYRLVLTREPGDPSQGKSTDRTDVVDARFLAVGPGHRIVLAITFDTDDPSLQGTMMMTWELDPFDGEHTKTRVTVRAEDVPRGITAADHAVGLASSLANLDAYLAAETPEHH